jgi:hypothetical protein
LHQAIPLYKKLTGRRQLSWSCRSFPSVNTLDLLARAASSIIPIPATTYFIDHAGTRILVVPYSKTLNDGRYLIAPATVMHVPLPRIAAPPSTTCSAKPTRAAAA